MAQVEFDDEDGVRIRAFVARTMPIPGSSDMDDEVWWEGRSLIEQLAIPYEEGEDDSSQRWDLLQCASVVKFLHSIFPVKGRCFCGEENAPLDKDDPVSSVCGYHIVLEHMEGELRRIAQQAKKVKKAA